MEGMVFHLLCFCQASRATDGLQGPVLAVATSNHFFYYVLFQLAILTCLCFDSNGYSERVKGQVVFRRMRTPSTHLF